MTFLAASTRTSLDGKAAEALLVKLARTFRSTMSAVKPSLRVLLQQVADRTAVQGRTPQGAAPHAVGGAHDHEDRRLAPSSTPATP